MMRSLLAALSLALLLSLASLSEGSVIKRESMIDPYEELNSCYRAILIGCTRPRMSRFAADLSSDESRVAFVGNRQKLGDFADTFQALKTCAETKQAEPECVGYSEEESGLDEIRFIAGYLSSPARVDIVVGTSGSPCLTNSSKLDQLGDQSVQCMQNFLPTVSAGLEVCAGIQDLRSCSVAAGSSVCGAGVGAFFHSLWAYSSKPSVDASPLFGIIPHQEIASLVENCNQQDRIIRRYAKRALSFLRM